jgi:hypothetical protein
MSFEMPRNPVEIAALRAEDPSFYRDELKANDNDHLLLAELDYAAEHLGYHGTQYEISAYRTLAVSASFEADKPVKVYDIFRHMSFRGTFETYAHVRIGRIIGAHSVRAVCLAFSDAILYPTFERIPDEDLLYVPVLAVDSIALA